MAENAIKIHIYSAELDAAIEKANRLRVKTALVRTVERLVEEATTAAEVEALAAVAHVFCEIDSV